MAERQLHVISTFFNALSTSNLDPVQGCTVIYHVYKNSVDPQARSQTEARKPGLQHHMSFNANHPDFVAC